MKMILAYEIREEIFDKRGNVTKSWILQSRITDRWTDTLKSIDPTSLRWGPEHTPQILSARNLSEATAILAGIVNILTWFESNIYNTQNFSITYLLSDVVTEMTYGPSDKNGPNEGIGIVNADSLYEIIKDIYRTTGYGELTRTEYKRALPFTSRTKRKLFDYWCRRLSVEYQTLRYCTDGPTKFELVISYLDIKKKVVYEFDKETTILGVVNKSTEISSGTGLPKKKVFEPSGQESE